MRFITEYQRINQKIIRDSHPLPRICETIQILQELQYATSLDLNIGYYTIDLSTEINDLTTIVTEFGKFRYNSVPTGLCASGDTFKAKLDEFLADIKGFKTYIGIILVLGKCSSPHKIDQLRVVFARRIVTARKQRQIGIGNIHRNSIRVRND